MKNKNVVQQFIEDIKSQQYRGFDAKIADTLQKALMKPSWISKVIFVSGIWSYKEINGISFVSFFVDERGTEIKSVALTSESSHVEGEIFTMITECDYEGTLVKVILYNDKLFALDFKE